MIVIFLMICFLITGCAGTPIRFQSLPVLNQETYFKDGKEFFVSFKDRGSVAIVLDPLSQVSDNKIYFNIYVKNISDVSCVFSEENVHAVLENNQIVRAIPEYEVLNKIESRRRTAIALTALAGALQGIGESQSASQRQYSGTITTQRGSTIMYQGSVYDPEAGAEAQERINRQTERNLSAINSDAAIRSQNLSQALLKKQTIAPGGFHKGMAMLDLSNFTMQSQKSLDLIIEFNGESHIFRLLQK